MNRRVAIIGCQHETNTFLADTTDLTAFDQGTIYGSRAQGREILSRRRVACARGRFCASGAGS